MIERIAGILPDGFLLNGEFLIMDRDKK